MHEHFVHETVAVKRLNAGARSEHMKKRPEHWVQAALKGVPDEVNHAAIDLIVSS